MIYYFDNAATTIKKPQSVSQAVYEGIASEKYGNPSRGAHEVSLNSFRSIYATRQKVAELFHLDNELYVAFTMNATMALNLVIQGLFQSGDHIISTDLEHNSVLRPLYSLKERQGVNTSFVSYDTFNNQLRYEEFEKLLQPNTKAVVCTHASNVIGDVLDLERISKFCQKHQLLLVVDASQTAGVFDIDMDKMGIDVLCFTGHKSLYGPQGTGGICVRGDVPIQAVFSGGSGSQSFLRHQPESMPDRLETGTANVHGLMGLGAGIDYILEKGTDTLKNKQQMMAEKFYQEMAQLSQIKIYGNMQGERAAIVSLNIGEVPSAEVANTLFEEYQIAVRPGAHCAPRVHETFGTEEQGMVRFSFSSFTTEDEITYAVTCMKKLIKKYERAERI